MVKILLFRPTPRGNISEVEQHNPNLPCDVLHVKYVLEVPAYEVGRKYFLEHNYDYFVIAPDDLIVTPNDITHLIKLCEENPPVISGLCNVSEMQLTETGVTNIVIGDLPSKILQERKYNWVPRNKLPEGIFKAAFSGFALMAIRRDILQRFPFDGGAWLEKNNSGRGGLDLVFCYKCQENDIPVLVDRDLDMVHLRYSGKMNVGIKLPEVWLNEQQLSSFDFELEP